MGSEMIIFKEVIVRIILFKTDLTSFFIHFFRDMQLIYDSLMR